MFSGFKDYSATIDGRHWAHREVPLGPTNLRRYKKWVYIITDPENNVIQEFIDQTDGLFHDLDSFSDEKISDSAFYIYFNRAERVLPLLKRIVRCNGAFAPPPSFAKMPFHAVSAFALDSINEAGRGLGHEPFGGLEIHAQICQAVELTRDVPGDFVEVGVFSGSSALTALTHMRNLNIARCCYLLDTYSGFTYPVAKESSDIIWSGTHLIDPTKTIKRIETLMEPTGQEVHAIQTEICTDELPSAIQQIALANIDVDLYEAVFAALLKLSPLMAHRGIMIVEDPTSLPGLYGAYLAMTEFLETDIGRDFIGVRTTTQYFLIRVQPSGKSAVASS
jgi:hypothetical protein